MQGGPKSTVTRELRREIVEQYLSGDHAGAQAKATALGLRSDYAYRTAHESGRHIMCSCKASKRNGVHMKWCPAA